MISDDCHQVVILLTMFYCNFDSIISICLPCEHLYFGEVHAENGIIPISSFHLFVIRFKWSKDAR
jgi:hypothetical protein